MKSGGPVHQRAPEHRLKSRLAQIGLACAAVGAGAAVGQPAQNYPVTRLACRDTHANFDYFASAFVAKDLRNWGGRIFKGVQITMADSCGENFYKNFVILWRIKFYFSYFQRFVHSGHNCCFHFHFFHLAFLSRIFTFIYRRGVMLIRVPDGLSLGVKIDRKVAAFHAPSALLIAAERTGVLIATVFVYEYLSGLEGVCHTLGP